MRGRLELDRLFTGFEQSMVARGAIEINFGRDFAALRRDGWSERRPNKITTLFASRVLIEDTVRGLLRKIPKVEMIERVEAVVFRDGRAAAGPGAGLIAQADHGAGAVAPARE